MKTILNFIFICFVLAACSEQKEEIPENILSQKEMTEILTDIHLAQASIGMQTVNDSLKLGIKDYIPSILKQHGVKKEDFNTSLKFYSGRPDLFNQVYDSVITGLSKIQGVSEY